MSKITFYIKNKKKEKKRFCATEHIKIVPKTIAKPERGMMAGISSSKTDKEKKVFDWSNWKKLFYFILEPQLVLQKLLQSI